MLIAIGRNRKPATTSATVIFRRLPPASRPKILRKKDMSAERSFMWGMIRGEALRPGFDLAQPRPRAVSKRPACWAHYGATTDAGGHDDVPKMTSWNVWGDMGVGVIGWARGRPILHVATTQRMGAPFAARTGGRSLGGLEPVRSTEQGG